MLNCNRDYIAYQYKCLYSDVPFSDFDQVCQNYLSIESNYSPYTPSPFVKTVIDSIQATKIPPNIVANYFIDEFIEARIAQIKDAVCDFWNITINPKIYIVDELPGNFHLSSWKAMYVDKEQSKLFTIPEGLYYKSLFVSPVLFELLICHEMMHLVLFQLSDHFRTVKSTALEEGLCDFFSYLILTQYGIITDFHSLNKFILSNRSLCSITNPIRYTYWVYSFKAAVVYSRMPKKDFIRRVIINGESVDIISCNKTIIANDSDFDLVYSIFLNSASKIVLPEKEYRIFKRINGSENYLDVLNDSELKKNELDKILNSLERKWILCRHQDLIINNVSPKDVYFYFSQTGNLQ